MIWCCLLGAMVLVGSTIVASKLMASGSQFTFRQCRKWSASLALAMPEEVLTLSSHNPLDLPWAGEFQGASDGAKQM
jgi:hypothetical protein